MKSTLHYLVAFLSGVSICLSATVAEAREAPLRVLATTGMIADAVAQLAPGIVEVESLIAPGVDPHLYKPTRTDIARILAADVVLYNGLFLEGKMIDALQRAKAAGRNVVAVAEVLPKEQQLDSGVYQGQSDPHVWMDPLLWKEVVKVISSVLRKELPLESPRVVENTTKYLELLEQLHEYARRSLASINEEKRVLVTAHDAFNYFGARYGVAVLGVQGLSTESEAGVRDIERIVDLLVEKSISAVFIESTISERNILALIEGAKAKGQDVVVGGTLYSDAMGAAGSYEGTYVGMLDHNITTIVRALGGSAPEAGFQNRLSGSVD